MIEHAWEVLSFICIAITTLGGAGAIVIAVIKWWKQPDKDRDIMISSHEKKLDNDNKRLNELEESNKVIMQSMLAIMNHLIDGDHRDQLQKAKDDLQEYLINRR